MQQIREQIKELELQQQFLRGRLTGLEEAQRSNSTQPTGLGGSSTAKKLLSTPDVTVGNAMRQAMVALREFTKADVANWVRSTYPHLLFSDKSWSRPLREMLNKGQVVRLKPNAGNKTQAVYGLKATSSVR